MGGREGEEENGGQGAREGGEVDRETVSEERRERTQRKGSTTATRDWPYQLSLS